MNKSSTRKNDDKLDDQNDHVNKPKTLNVQSLARGGDN